jgi:hypothetical protein
MLTAYDDIFTIIFGCRMLRVLEFNIPYCASTHVFFFFPFSYAFSLAKHIYELYEISKCVIQV